MEWYELLLVFLAIGFLIKGVCVDGYCAEEKPQEKRARRETDETVFVGRGYCTGDVR